MAFEFPEEVTQRLLQCCGVKEFDDKGNPNPIPKPVADLFEKFYRAFRRGGGSVVGPDTYAIIVALAGEASVAKACDIQKPNLASMWFKKEVGYGDVVSVFWRNEWKPAKILSAKPNRKEVKVQIDGDGEERYVPTEVVGLAMAQEVAI